MAQPITIRDIKVIATQPGSQRLVLVKVLTSEPGLYGVGCATFTQRHRAVVAALEQHLIPFAIGREVDRIEEFFQMAMVHGYWRNGPVLNNAISGIDQALWDIKGKRAGMPVYQLFGGPCREAAACYAHAGGPSIQHCLDSVRALMADGYQHIRVQLGNYGGLASNRPKPDGARPGAYYDPRDYVRQQLACFDHLRSELGFEIELLHDIHERLSPIDAIGFAKDLERHKLFFLEDALAPEDLPWFAQLRAQCATPLAMGELFNNPREWQPLIEARQIDYIRMHVSQMGGLTPARQVATMAAAYGIRTAWHGPADTSPVGHAANLHLDLWAPNFGVQEWCRFPELMYEVFPGLPVVRRGYMYPNDLPGLGIDINETLAAKFPVRDEVEQWTQTRRPDGTPARP
jgi:mannonate dehydratase